LCSGVLSFRLAEVRAGPVVPVWQCPATLERQRPGVTALERALAERPRYPLVWIFFAPVLSHVVVSPLCWRLRCWPSFECAQPCQRRCTPGCDLADLTNGARALGVGCRALQKKVKWSLVHPFMRWLGRFLSLCNLVPPFVVFVGRSSKR